jgi:putative PIN family toxin of toxin-antitoxin system
LRVVLDTNILLSALILPNQPPARLVAAWLEGRFDLVTGEAQLDELRRASRYPALRKRFKPAEAGRLVNDLRALAKLIKRSPRVSASDDPDDNLLLGVAIGAKADYLVTGDKSGLLGLRKVRGARIVTARTLCDALRLRAPKRDGERR